MQKIIAYFICCLISISTFANHYDDAWKLIQSKKYDQAIAALNKAVKDPATAMDAYFTLIYLKTYQGVEEEIPGLIDALSKSKDKNSYIYSSWFNGSLLGQYSKKAAHQMKLIQQIETDNTFNNSIKAANNYVKGMHYVFSNAYKTAIPEWNKMGAFQNWQYVGPFENLSGSGFNAHSGPLNQPDSSVTFKGLNNIDIKWYTPAGNSYEGWVLFHRFSSANSAISYAQSFVYAPEDMKVVLNIGVNGSVKAWVNDKLLIIERKERTTELDYYKNYCTLKKGYNRVLLQIGYSSVANPNFILRFTDEAMQPITNLTSTSVIQQYPKDHGTSSPTSIRHFAESFFEKKIQAEPGNLINYVLLSQTYLRNSRITEARQVIEDALKLAPENPLLRFELIQVLIKAGNRTQLVQELDWLKENDPESYGNYSMKIQTLNDEEKYVEAAEAIDKMIALYGESEETLTLKAGALGKLEKVDELITLVEDGYKKYPANLGFVNMMFAVKKLIRKDINAALKVYEDYLKNNFSSNVVKP